MSSYSIVEKTVTHTRFELRLPTNVTELAKACNAAINLLARHTEREVKDLWDDELNVTVEDDLLVIWFKM